MTDGQWVMLEAVALVDGRMDRWVRLLGLGTGEVAIGLMFAWRFVILRLEMRGEVRWREKSFEDGRESGVEMLRMV